MTNENLENNNSELNVEESTNTQSNPAKEKKEFVPRASKEIERKGLDKIEEELKALREENKTMKESLKDISSLKLDSELNALGVKSEDARLFLKDYAQKTGTSLSDVMQDETIKFHIKKLEGNSNIDVKRPKAAPGGTDDVQWYIQNKVIPTDAKMRKKVREAMK